MKQANLFQYFAEAYFDDVEGFANKKPELFCETIKVLPREKTIRLQEIVKKINCLK